MIVKCTTPGEDWGTPAESNVVYTATKHHSEWQLVAVDAPAFWLASDSFEAALRLGYLTAHRPPARGKSYWAKYACRHCEYHARTTAKCITLAGAPHCPDHGAMQQIR